MSERFRTGPLYSGVLTGDYRFWSGDPTLDTGTPLSLDQLVAYLESLGFSTQEMAQFEAHHYRAPGGVLALGLAARLGFGLLDLAAPQAVAPAVADTAMAASTIATDTISIRICTLGTK